MNEDKNADTKLPDSPADPLLEKLKNTFLAHNLPLAEQGTQLNYVSTREILEQFYSLYPALQFDAAELAQWLHSKGFNFVKTGTNYEWQLYVL